MGGPAAPGGVASAGRDADRAAGHPPPLRPDRRPPGGPEADHHCDRRAERELRRVSAARLPAAGPLQPASRFRRAGAGPAGVVPAGQAVQQPLLPPGGPGREAAVRGGFPAVLDRGPRRSYPVLPAHPYQSRRGRAGPGPRHPGHWRLDAVLHVDLARKPVLVQPGRPSRRRLPGHRRGRGDRRRAVRRARPPSIPRSSSSPGSASTAACSPACTASPRRPALSPSGWAGSRCRSPRTPCSR